MLITRIQFREHLFEDVQINVNHVQFTSEFGNLFGWQVSNNHRTTATIPRWIVVNSVVVTRRRHGSLLQVDDPCSKIRLSFYERLPDEPRWSMIFGSVLGFVVLVRSRADGQQVEIRTLAVCILDITR